MTLNLANPITKWQENKSDNKPATYMGSSGPVWFVVKLTRKHLLGIYNKSSNEWIHSANETYADNEVGWFIELPTSTFDHIPQEPKCLLTSDIVGPVTRFQHESHREWSLMVDLACDYQNIMPHHYLQDGNDGFHEWLIKGCPELQKVEFTFNHEHSCACYFFKSDKQASKFIGVVNKFLEEQFKLGAK